MPPRSSRVRYSSKPAPGSTSRAPAVPYSSCLVRTSSAQSSRQARWSSGRYGRTVTRSAMLALEVRRAGSVIASYLLSLPPLRSNYGAPHGSGISPGTPAPPASVPDPPTDPGDTGGRWQHLHGDPAHLGRRNLGLRQDVAEGAAARRVLR